jgi:hypothetical protein
MCLVWVSEQTAIISLYTHLSLFVGSYFTVSEIRWVASRIKVHQSGPSVDKSIRFFDSKDKSSSHNA